MFALRGALVLVSTTALVAAVAITISGTPEATAANSASLEAESMTVTPSNAGSTVRDASASGGLALSLRAGATASKAVALTASSAVVVRARGQRTCGSTPVMSLFVDGTSISTVQVTAASWTDYTTPIVIPAGSHTIGVGFANQGRSSFCNRSLVVDRVTVVASATQTTTTTTSATTTTPSPTTTTNPPTPTSSTPIPTSPTSVPAARLFNGDYSTGNFAQWQTVQTKYYNSSGANYQPAYPATIVSDPQKGNAGRFEVRSGDVPNFGGGERSEVSADSQSGGTEGQTRWYQFSTRFDPTFPQNHADLGWGVTNQWHSNSSTGSPPVAWIVNARNGYWSLFIQRQSSPGTYLNTFSIFDVPLGTDWRDVKMQVNWSPSDTAGWIRLWLNGVRQTFVDGTDTYYVRTMIPGTTSIYYKEGYYRQAMRPTGIVYHSGFRSATEEGGLN